jgi:predicted kinase
MNHSQEIAVTTTLEKRGIQAIKHNKHLVIDSTNNNHRGRKELINFIRKHGAKKVIGIYVNPGLEKSLQRNRQGDRNVPEEFVMRMHDRLMSSPPHINEGFDNLFFVN